MRFSNKLAQAVKTNDSLVCVGLDPDPAKLPAAVQDKDNPVLYFNKAIIDATADLVCIYKPNWAFYGALGASAWSTIKGTVDHVPEQIPVLVDAKVGDIGSTAERYAQMFFDKMGADALTVTPYMGTDAVEPFTAYTDKGVILICLTSNPGAEDFEKQALADGPLYEYVARQAQRWNHAGNCGLVVGATQPEHMAQMRALVPEMPFLIPGIGAQGGDLQTAVSKGQDAAGAGIMINSSRGIIYASNGPDFAQAARRAVLELRDSINKYRNRSD